MAFFYSRIILKQFLSGENEAQISVIYPDDDTVFLPCKPYRANAIAVIATMFTIFSWISLWFFSSFKSLLK